MTLALGRGQAAAALGRDLLQENRPLSARSHRCCWHIHMKSSSNYALQSLWDSPSGQVTLVACQGSPTFFFFLFRSPSFLFASFSSLFFPQAKTSILRKRHCPNRPFSRAHLAWLLLLLLLPSRRLCPFNTTRKQEGADISVFMSPTATYR